MAPRPALRFNVRPIRKPGTYKFSEAPRVGYEVKHTPTLADIETTRYLKLGPKPTVVEVSLEANVVEQTGDKGTYYQVHVLVDGHPAVVSGSGALIEEMKRALKGRKGVSRVSLVKDTDEGGSVLYSAERMA